MKNKTFTFIAASILVVLLGGVSAGGAKKMTGNKILYRVVLVGDESKAVTVRQIGKDLRLSLEGFGQPVALKVSGGGTRTCRTVVEHKSEQAQVTLSLPIPAPNVPCQMTAGFVSINSRTYKISTGQEEVRKTTGNDSQLRKLIERYFGKI